MFESLKDKRIVITGGSGIIGSNLIQELVKHEAKIFVIDIKNTKSTQKNIIYFKGDITSPDDLTKFYTIVKSKVNAIDVIINNAASKSSDLKKYFKDFENYELKTWNEVINVNITGIFLVTQKFSSLLKKSKKNPSIINISSIYGVIAPDQRIYNGAKYLGQNINTPACYSVSKSAVLGFTNYLSSYWLDLGIRANSISPGGILSGQNEAFLKKYSKKVPLNRMANVNEIIDSIIFLCSDKSTYINGQNIIVDGGLSKW